MANYEDLLQRIVDLTNKSSSPLRPDSFGKNYAFPEDLTVLTNEEIGQFMSRLGAYRGYCSRQAGIAEIQRESWSDILKMRIPEFIAQVERLKGMTKTDVKDAAKYVPEAMEIRKKISEVDKIFKFYFSLANVYTGQIEILSREITRRRDKDI